MPRECKVPIEDAVDVIKRFMKHFLTDKLPAFTSKTWKDMSAALDGRWSAQNVYTNVRENRRGIFTLAKEQFGIRELSVLCERLEEQDLDVSQIPDNNNSDYRGIQEGSFSKTTSDTTKIKTTDKFKLVLSQEDWDMIKPDISRGFDKPAHKAQVWNVIAIAFREQYKLQCTYVFERAEVTLSADGHYDIMIEGRCRSAVCDNRFVGKASKNVSEMGGLTVEVDTRDTRGETHERVKCPLNDNRKREIKKELISKGCSRRKKRKALKTIDMGAAIPPILPCAVVLKRARKVKIDPELEVQSTDVRDIVRTIEKLAGTMEYAGIIQAVGFIPFYVFYSTPAQLHVYNEYCRIFKDKSVITLGATGNLVGKLSRPGNRETEHIFLYSVVVNSEKTTLPVYQMLSEDHYPEFIEFWLRSWIRIGARKPRKAVCDYSRALIAGTSEAFNNMTVKMYVNACFEMSQCKGRSTESIVTFIRINVAHLLRMVCRWSSFQLARQRAIKNFYVQCIALMIECRSTAQFRRIFLLTCTIGVQEYDDSIVNFPQQGTTREARRILEKYMAVRDIDVYFEERISDNTDVPSADCGDTPSTSTPIEKWVEDLVTQAHKTIRTGVELNPFYHPDFVQELTELAKEFPLWTAVTLPYEAQQAKSSYVEGYLNDLKTRVLENHAGPMRVDKFLKKHADDIMRAVPPFAELIDLKKGGDSVTILPSRKFDETEDTYFTEESLIESNADKNDLDLPSQEDWRAKATVQNMEDGEDPLNNTAVELNWSNDQIKREPDPIPSRLQTLDDRENDSTLFDHSYNEVKKDVDISNKIVEEMPISTNTMNIIPYETIEPQNNRTNELTSTHIDDRVMPNKNYRSEVHLRVPAIRSFFDPKTQRSLDEAKNMSKTGQEQNATNPKDSTAWVHDLMGKLLGATARNNSRTGA